MKTSRVLNILFREFPIYYFARMANILPNNIITCKLRGSLVGLFFKQAGKNFQLAQGSIINYPEKIEVGENVYIAHRTYINARAGLTICNNVTIGPNSIIATGNHQVSKGVVLDNGNEGEIVIGEGTWIGGNVTITNDVHIGKGVTVGAGSVVTKDIPDGKIVGGVPAKIIG